MKDDRKRSILVMWPEHGRIDRIMSNGSMRTDVGHVNSNGYKILRARGKMHQSHRLLYAAAHGAIAAGFEIDHINGVKTDNRIANLRLVSHEQNMQNKHCAYKNNKTGVKGVGLKNGKYRARIRVAKRLIEIGIYDTVEQAAKAYKNAAAVYHTHNPFAEV